MEIRFATNDSKADIEWLLGTEYDPNTPELRIDPTKLHLTIIGIIIAFGLNHS